MTELRFYGDRPPGIEGDSLPGRLIVIEATEDNKTLQKTIPVMERLIANKARRGHTLVAVSSLDNEVRENLKGGGNVAAAKGVGQVLAKRAKQLGVSRVVFDRGGYAYHGRIKALADAAREGGLQF